MLYFYFYFKSKNQKKFSFAWFRSRDLWVMSPTPFLLATKLDHCSKEAYFNLPFYNVYKYYH